MTDIYAANAPSETTATKICETGRDKISPRIVIVTFLIFIVAIFVAIATPRIGFVTVVGRPGMTQADMLNLIDRSGGQYVSSGNLPWIATVYSDTPEFPGRARASGAVLVLSSLVAAGCIASRPTL